eukprot:4934188-Pleurochrysis_carterae.AAC.1
MNPSCRARSARRLSFERSDSRSSFERKDSSLAGRRARARESLGSFMTALWCAASVSPKSRGASFLIRRNAKRASASLSAARSATASRLALRFASFTLWRSTASRQVS